MTKASTANKSSKSKDEEKKAAAAGKGGSATANGAAGAEAQSQAPQETTTQETAPDQDVASAEVLISKLGDKKIRDLDGKGKAYERARRASDILSIKVRDDGKSAGVVLIDGSKHEVEL